MIANRGKQEASKRPDAIRRKEEESEGEVKETTGRERRSLTEEESRNQETGEARSSGQSTSRNTPTGDDDRH